MCTTTKLLLMGGGGGSKLEHVAVNCKDATSWDFCLKYVQEFGLSPPYTHTLSITYTVNTFISNRHFPRKKEKNLSKMPLVISSIFLFFLGIVVKRVSTVFLSILYCHNTNYLQTWMAPIQQTLRITYIIKCCLHKKIIFHLFLLEAELSTRG